MVMPPLRLRTIPRGGLLKGKRVLIRIDANVPISRHKVVDGKWGKVARAAVDLEWLRQHGAKVIVMAHLGRPNGRRIPAYSLAPVAERLSELLHVRVPLSRQIVGPMVERFVEAMKEGDVVLLENVRFEKGEDENDLAFAKALARLGDMYINDAFADSHRRHASIDAITRELPAYAGPLFAHEVRILEGIREAPRHPFVVVVGGKKIGSKLPLFEAFLSLADQVLLGGALAHPFLVAAGFSIGKSVQDEEEIPLARQLLKRFKEKILLPIDVRVATSLNPRAKSRECLIQEIDPTEMILDIGSKTVELFSATFQKAKTVVWNGPLGYCEVKAYCKGTHAVAQNLSARTGRTKTIIGGGDTIPAIEGAHLEGSFTLVSTGGGAMLDFLGGGELPGLEAVRRA